MACFDKRLQSRVSATPSFRSYLLAPDAGSVTHPHPPVINQEVITAVQLLIEASSCESHSFFSFFIFRVPPPVVLVNMMVKQKIISNGATHVLNLPIYPKVKNWSSQLSLYFGQIVWTHWAKEGWGLRWIIPKVFLGSIPILVAQQLIKERTSLLVVMGWLHASWTYLQNGSTVSRNLIRILILALLIQEKLLSHRMVWRVYKFWSLWKYTECTKWLE